jgi:hypothetical protein
MIRKRIIPPAWIVCFFDKKSYLRNMSYYSRIIGIDPGSESCGMVVLDGGQITAVFNIINIIFWDKVTNFLIHPNCIVVLEDIRPYSMRLMPQVIDTCKFIGEAVYRLRTVAGANVELITRSEVKKWVFDQFPDVCEGRVDKKILKKAFAACDTASGKEILVKENGDAWKARKGSFVYVDDKIVKEAMKHHYDIPKPPPGDGYKYGLKDDAWQALAIATLYHSRSHQFVT